MGHPPKIDCSASGDVIFRWYLISFRYKIFLAKRVAVRYIEVKKIEKKTG
jgi:hypothetical protein